jgi:hypothetical protein
VNIFSNRIFRISLVLLFTTIACSLSDKSVQSTIEAQSTALGGIKSQQTSQALTAMAKPSSTVTPILTSTIPVKISTITPQVFIIPAGTFALDTDQDCSTDAIITGSDSSGLEVSGTLSMINNNFVLWCPGAKHTWQGTLTYEGYNFASDLDNPLQFTVTVNGYVYLGGSGSVTAPDGTVTYLGGEQASNNPDQSSKIYVVDNFDDDSNDWSTGDVEGDWWSGTRLVQNGVLDWNGVSKQSMYSIIWPNNPNLQDSLADQLVSVWVNLVYKDMQGSYGLAIRAKDSHNFYTFLVGYGQFAFFLLENGKWNTLIDWSESSYLTSEGWNKMSIKAIDSHFSLFFNDHLIGEYDDATFASGYTGVIVTNDTSGGTIQVQFDNFEIDLPPSA